MPLLALGCSGGESTESPVTPETPPTLSLEGISFDFAEDNVHSVDLANAIETAGAVLTSVTVLVGSDLLQDVRIETSSVHLTPNPDMNGAYRLLFSFEVRGAAGTATASGVISPRTDISGVTLSANASSLLGDAEVELLGPDDEVFWTTTVGDGASFGPVQMDEAATEVGVRVSAQGHFQRVRRFSIGVGEDLTDVTVSAHSMQVILELGISAEEFVETYMRGVYYRFPQNSFELNRWHPDDLRGVYILQANPLFDNGVSLGSMDQERQGDFARVWTGPDQVTACLPSEFDFEVVGGPVEDPPYVIVDSLLLRPDPGWILHIPDDRMALLGWEVPSFGADGYITRVRARTNVDSALVVGAWPREAATRALGALGATGWVEDDWTHAAATVKTVSGAVRDEWGGLSPLDLFACRIVYHPETSPQDRLEDLLGWR